MSLQDPVSLAAETEKFRLAAEAAMEGGDPEAAVLFRRIGAMSELSRGIARLLLHVRHKYGLTPELEEYHTAATEPDTAAQIRSSAASINALMDVLEKV